MEIPCQCQVVRNQGQQFVAKGRLPRRGICRTGLNMIREKSERIRSGTIRSGEPLTVIRHERLSFSTRRGMRFRLFPFTRLGLALTLLFSLTLPFPAPYSASRVFLLLSILLPDSIYMRDVYMCMRSINALYEVDMRR